MSMSLRCTSTAYRVSHFLVAVSVHGGIRGAGTVLSGAIEDGCGVKFGRSYNGV